MRGKFLGKSYRVDTFELRRKTGTELATEILPDTQTDESTLREALIHAAKELGWMSPPLEWEDTDGTVSTVWKPQKNGSDVCVELWVVAVSEWEKVGRTGKAVGRVIEEVPLRVSLRRLGIALRHQTAPFRFNEEGALSTAN